MNTAAPVPPEKNIYQFQNQVLPVLAGWSLGSIISGMFWQKERDTWLKGFGQQMVGWGVVDLAIAFFGLKGGQKKAADFQAGSISIEKHNAQAESFKNILLVNAFLDVGYVLAGKWLANSPNRHKQGMGWGIIIQGLFLLVWDSLLVALVKKHFPGANT